MRYHAMIGNIGYMDTQADNEDQARANFAVSLRNYGEGIYKRWRDAGMAIAVFRRGILLNAEERRSHSKNEK